MSEPKDEFATLMARVRRDDNQALARMIALYEPAIQRTARVLLGKTLRASLDPTDLVQSVRLQLILGLRREKLMIGSADQLRALAVTLLRHKLIEHWRRHRCESRYHTTLALNGSAADSGTTAIRGGNPAWAVEYDDLIDHLYQHLRAEERRLVIMRLHGYRTREIAAELGVSPELLRVRLSRLRKRLLRAKPPTDWV